MNPSRKSTRPRSFAPPRHHSPVPPGSARRSWYSRSRRGRARAIALRTLLCLALGAATTVIVAWAIQLYTPLGGPRLVVQDDYLDSLVPPERGDSAVTVRAGSRCRVYLEREVLRPELDGKPNGGWHLVRFLLRDYQLGWPARSLEGATSVCSNPGAETVGFHGSVYFAAPRVNKARLSTGEYPQVLPLRPIPSGLAIDTLVYGASWAIAFALLSRVTRRFARPPLNTRVQWRRTSPISQVLPMCSRGTVVVAIASVALTAIAGVARAIMRMESVSSSGLIRGLLLEMYDSRDPTTFGAYDQDIEPVVPLGFPFSMTRTGPRIREKPLSARRFELDLERAEILARPNPLLPSEYVVIPLRPSWPGLIANLVVWSIIPFGLLVGSRALALARQERRRRRGACANCGYQLAGVSTCPECGSMR